MGSTLRDDDVSPGLIHRHTSSDLIEHDFHLSCAHVTEGAVEPTSGWLFLAAIFSMVIFQREPKSANFLSFACK
jgi:hypothetical protein